MISAHLFLSIVTTVGFVGAVRADERVLETIDGHIARLGSAKKADRLEALHGLRSLTAKPAIERALPTLARLVKTETDVEVCRQAIETLGMISYRRGKPCPMALVELLFDKNRDLSSTAFAVATVHKKFPTEAKPYLQKMADHREARHRAQAVEFLGLMKADDEKTVALLRKRIDDPNSRVRHSAHLAYFQTSGKVERLLEHCLDVLAKSALVAPRPLPEGAPLQDKQDQSYEALAALGATIRFVELAEGKHRDKTLAVLTKRLNHREEFERFRAVVAVGKIASNMESFASMWDDGEKSVLETFQKGRLVGHVSRALEEMSKKDKSVLVRSAAGVALGKVAKAKKAKPRPFFLGPSNPHVVPQAGNWGGVVPVRPEKKP